MSRNSTEAQPTRHRRVHQRQAVRRKLRRTDRRALQVESLETRRLLAGDLGDDIAMLSDEFSDSASISAWQRVNEVENWNADQLQTWDVDQTQPDRMVMVPHSVVWYQNWRGPMAFKEVAGDFVITSEVHITDRDELGNSDADDVPSDAQFSLGGLMIRTPRDIQDPANDWTVGSGAEDGTNTGENYVFLSMGYGDTGNQFSFEVKNTRNSNSQLELTPADSNTATLQTARVGDSIITLYQVPGEDWVVHRRFRRADMPETLQVGIVSYSDWGKASDFDPFYHNGHVLEAGVDDPTPNEPFNPDLVASFEYARFVRPDVPTELDGLDLVSGATDSQLLSFLGANANPDPGTNPAPDPATIVVEATTPQIVESSGQAIVFTVARDNDHVAEDVTIAYSISGSATEGLDYVAASGEVTIEAGQSTAAIDLALADDTLIEGAETISLELLESMFYQLGESSSATATIADDDFQVIADQTMSASQDMIAIELAATHPDGAPLSYSARIVGDEAYLLDQQLGLFSSGDYYTNWGGQQEKWLQGGDGGWYFILPSGEFGHWQEAFDESPVLATLAPTYYDDPSQLHDAQPVATATISSGLLTIDPAEGLVGEFEVDLTTSNVAASSTQRFTVSVGNEAPVLSHVADQTMSHSQDTLAVDIVASDPDGDSLEISVSIVQPQTYQLDQQHGLTTDGNFYENWGGRQERWIRDGDGNWFYLLPDGDLHDWQGEFDASPLVAALGHAVYDDPTQLTDAQAVSATASLDGSTVTIDPAAEFAGNIELDVVASDGISSASQTFVLTVTNAAPTLAPIDDQIMAAGQSTLNVALDVADADGDDVAMTVALIDEAYELDQSLELTTDGEFYVNWGGQQEKWVRDAADGWYYLLPSGEFYRWHGSFASSTRLASLDVRYYDDPHLLTDAQPLQATASFVDNVLVIHREDETTGQVRVRVTASDELVSTSQVFVVTME